MDGHQRGGHAGEELHGADDSLRAHQREEHPEPQHDRPRRMYGQQREAERDEQGQIGDEQRRVQVHERGDLDLQPGHRLGDALVTRRAGLRR